MITRLTLSVCTLTTDYVIAVNTIRITVNEDGSFRTGSDLEISESGYSFGDVEVTVTPLTYTQYERQTGQDIAETFVRQPTEASGGTIVLRLQEMFSVKSYC